MKICTKCKQEKSIKLYSQAKGNTDGLKAYCKNCESAYNKARKEKIRQQSKPILESLTCSLCKVTKNVSEFTKDNGSLIGYHSHCKECKHPYFKTSEHREKSSKRRSERVQWLRSIKANTPCKDCGIILEPECMDYDHIGDDKIDNVSYMVIHNAPEERILSEIKKCELVCLFCHNRRTLKRFGDGERKYGVRQLKHIEIINKAKSKPCEICGKQYEPINMQFDHRDPFEKVANICQLETCKTDKLLTELDKCMVLCAACHRKKSLEEQKNKLYPAPKARENFKVYKKKRSIKNPNQEI